MIQEDSFYSLDICFGFKGERSFGQAYSHGNIIRFAPPWVMIRNSSLIVWGIIIKTLKEILKK